MKAVIMAGGEGSRLRPLTCSRPKPMMPVMNRPMMEHIVALLKQHGIDDIGVTLQYLPDAIRDYFGSGCEFGVNARYFLEEVPLGTAGSVKNAEEFLDETFIVISGDALTDFNLTEAIKFHKQKGSLATIVLTRVDCPLEYGVVITERDGRISQFLEKPSWGEVFSDTVNTGIYILEPEVLSYFKAGQKFDFSKDLFPLLMKNNLPMYGVVLDGYWCDIGNLKQYLQAHYDVLTGNVQLTVPGKEIKHQVWVGNDVVIDPSAVINGPVLIGEGSKIGPGVKIEPYTVIGEGCRVEEQASIKRSVIGNGVYVGPKASLRSAALGSGVKVYANASLYEGSVVGDDTVIKERSIIKPDVKLWPNKVVDSGAVVQRSIVWGTNSPKNIFGIEGINGLANIEITPEFATSLGAAFGSVVKSGSTILVSSDNYPVCKMIKNAVISGLQSVGVKVKSLDAALTPVHRYAVRKTGCDAGVHVKISHLRLDKINILFTNSCGGNVSRSIERKIENKLARGDFLRADINQVSAVEQLPNAAEAYLHDLLALLDVQALKSKGFHLIVSYSGNNLENHLSLISDQTGIKFSRFQPGDTANYLNWQEYFNIVPRLGRVVAAEQADAGAVIDLNGEHIIILDEQGRNIQEERLTALLALVLLKEHCDSVVVPVTAPRAIDDLAAKYNSKVVRTKTAIHDLIDRVIAEDERKNSGVSQFLINFDAAAALIKILEFCAKKQIKLSALVDEIPAFFVDKREVQVPWEAKGRVIRHLIEEKPGQMELLDGVKVYHPNGWALVLPDSEEPVCRIYSEGSSMEIARELTDMYIKKINKITGT